MTNENFKVGDDLTLKEFECLLNQVGVQSVFNQANHFINGLFFNGIIKTLAQSAFQIGLSRKQSRIDLLESAIREFLYKPDTKNSLGANIYVETLRNLIENKS